jgi:hypothetical protein
MKEDYWCRVQDLFTRDVTGKGFRELVESDARETVAFFSRELDLDKLKARPFYARIPVGLFQMLEAIAWRLSPARRMLFAAAAVVLGVGWGHYLLTLLGRGPSVRFRP